MSWFNIDNIGQIDSPALIVYEERVKENIGRLVEMVDDMARLRPHVKTNKMAEVCSMLMDAGIRKFKCATIAEAEMLAMVGAPDVLLAYQPVGPKADRLLELIKNYPLTGFSCLIDNIASAAYLSARLTRKDLQLAVLMDIDGGMHRTGITPQKGFELAMALQEFSNIQLIGLHLYDGNITDTNLQIRQQRSDTVFNELLSLSQQIDAALNMELKLVVGGSPSFPTHLSRHNVECSPGTFVFWDWGYKHAFPDEPFDYAALVVTRVISIIDEQTMCLDLGHKSVAAENPLPRVHFLNAPDATPVGQSEEHMVVKLPSTSAYTPGDILYGVPVHICPTVALYEKAMIVENCTVTKEWKVVARNRSITI